MNKLQRNKDPEEKKHANKPGETVNKDVKEMPQQEDATDKKKKAFDDGQGDNDDNTDRPDNEKYPHR